MAHYSARGSMALVAADSVLSVIGSATVRPRIYEIIMSSSSAPQDYNAHFFFQRFSADGTGTAVTPKPLDFADPVAIATSKHTYTAEPTLTANEILLELGHHQRAVVRWVAREGKEIVVPALAGDGLAMVCNAVSTQFTEVATICFEE
jgi:hypothetical protein|tara:strand:- start:16766 stop:17209 length:444 start_codon:yes stop_codon:yes gene_type:complete